MKLRPSATQEGGDHYVTYDIQPAAFIHANKLDWFQGTILEYVLRFRDKNGKEDLLKAQHVIDMLKEFEYGPENEDSPADHQDAASGS